MPLIAGRIVEVCVFKFEKDRAWYLLLHRSKEEKIYPNLWQFVSGSIEGDEKAADAAYRELLEETGMTPKAFWVVPFVNSFYDPEWDSINFSPMFAAQVESGTKPILSYEHFEFGWFSYEEALQMLVWPGQRAGMRIVQEYIVRGAQAGIVTRLR